MTRPVERSGVAAIVHAFVANPTAAIQVFGFFFSLVGIYYALTNDITAMSMRMAAMETDDVKQWTKLDAMQKSSDLHYSGIIQKMTAYEVALARMTTTFDGISDQIKQRTFILDEIARKQAPRPQRP